MSLFGWINRRGSAPLARERLTVLQAYERTLGAKSAAARRQPTPQCILGKWPARRRA